MLMYYNNMHFQTLYHNITVNSYFVQMQIENCIIYDLGFENIYLSAFGQIYDNVRWQNDRQNKIYANLIRLVSGALSCLWHTHINK